MQRTPTEEALTLEKQPSLGGTASLPLPPETKPTLDRITITIPRRVLMELDELVEQLKLTRTAEDPRQSRSRLIAGATESFLLGTRVLRSSRGKKS